MTEHSSTGKGLDRRRFLKAGSLLGLGSFLLPRFTFGNERGEAQASGGCELTTDDIIGPYYLPGSPNTTQVAGPDEPGTRLFLSGTVLLADCVTPVPGAQIEVWQANDAGVYDPSPAFKLRGTLHTDANGLYAFGTIVPGAYLNGAQYRPKHIHYKITKPGFADLITQLYFEGDPYIADDPWASTPEAAMRIIPLNLIGEDQLEGVFDIVLDGTVGINPNRFGLDGDLLPPHPNPSADRTSIHFNVFHEAAVQVTVTDLDGREVVTLIAQHMVQGRYTTQWDGRSASGGMVAPGMYLAHLRMDGRVIKSHRIVRQ